MSFKKSVNHFRRTIMRRLTGGIGDGNLPKVDKEKPLELNRVLINRPNQRLGNILLITPLIQEIIRYNPDVKIDLFVKGKVAPIIFENYPQVDQIIEILLLSRLFIRNNLRNNLCLKIFIRIILAKNQEKGLRFSD